jgi:hypothetical protein
LFYQPIPEKTELEEWLVEEMDRSMSEAWLSGSADALTQLMHLILTENVSVDYKVFATLFFLAIV